MIAESTTRTTRPHWPVNNSRSAPASRPHWPANNSRSAPASRPHWPVNNSRSAPASRHQPTRSSQQAQQRPRDRWPYAMLGSTTVLIGCLATIVVILAR